jgi:Zn-dependent M16 (insulinase) family peptidase
MAKDLTKDEYIGRYVGKKMKGNKLPYGLQYLNLIAELEEKAEKQWERLIRKKIKDAN